MDTLQHMRTDDCFNFNKYSYEKSLKEMTGCTSAEIKQASELTTVNQASYVESKIDKKKHLTIKVLQLKYLSGLNQRQVAARLRVNPSVISRILKPLKHDPRDLYRWLKDKSACSLLSKTTVANYLRDTLTSGGQLFFNLPQIVQAMRSHFHTLESQSDTKIIKLCKGSIPRKVRSKHRPEKPRLINQEDGVALAKKAILYDFGVKKKMAIFDVTTFSDDLRPIKAWTIKGEKISFIGKKPWFYMHMLTCINADGIMAIQFAKKSLTKSDIMAFLSRTLQIYGSQNVVFLDNTPIHDRVMLNSLATVYDCRIIFNVPNQPDYNPVEWIFAPIKKVFREILASGYKASADAIVKAIRDVGQDKIVRVIDGCLNKII